MTYALREARERAATPLPAQTARRATPEALIALEIRGYSFHDPFHAANASGRFRLQVERQRNGTSSHVRPLLLAVAPQVATTVSAGL